MGIILLLFLSIFPVIVIASYIYIKDKDKEPVKVLLKLFSLGMLSTILTLLLSSISAAFFPILASDTSELNLIQLIFYVFVGIALIEEFSKWIFVYKVGYNHKEYDHVYDMIIYSTFVSLGFAALENILYVLQGGVSIAIMRALLAVPGHACYGTFMGYYLSLAKISDKNNNNSLSRKNKILSLLIPTLLHGIYDYCIFTEKTIFILLFFIFVIILYIFSIKNIKKLSNVKTNLLNKNKYCTNCGTEATGIFCSNCGNKINP